MPILLRRCRERVRPLTVALVAAFLPVLVVTQVCWAAPPRRAQPPKFSPQETSAIFFENVFEKLIGERPEPSARPTVVGTDPQPAPAESPASTSGSNWSQLISATTIEDEIKGLKPQVDQEITTPGQFRGRGYRVVRVHFSVLAMLFAIINEYEGDVRWKEQAQTARDRFAQTASNAKSGSTAVFDQAKLRKQDLQDLVAGSQLQAPGNSEPQNDWSAIVDRAPLMRRLESGFQNRLTPWTNSQSEFQSNQDEVIHEAELVAAIGHVLLQDGMADADDETYAGYVQRMKQAAREIVEAARTDNYEQARTAAGEVSKACSECHELYRG